MFKTVNIMGYKILQEHISSIKIENSDKTIVNTLNAHSYVTAKNDKKFKEALEKSDLLIPDGSGIVLASSFLNKEAIQKIAGDDLHQYLLSELQKTGGKCFYMGSSESTLDKIHEKLAKDFPNVEVESYSPPFKDEFSEKENEEIISKINAFSPNVLFVGMTAPKQEKWLYENKKHLNFDIASSIGAVFDFYAGTVKRPSIFWQNMHLEWLPRLCSEPKRLWKRNFVSTPLFLFELFLYKISIKKSKVLTYSSSNHELVEQVIHSS